MTMQSILRKLVFISIINLSSSLTVQAFSTSHSTVPTLQTSGRFSTHTHHSLPSQWDTLEAAALSSTTNHLAVVTIDPATALSQGLSGVLGSPIILLVPIFVGASVAAVIAYFIVWYANPTDPDADE